MSSSFIERVHSVSEPPECPICSERYDVDEEDFIPRNLACGHSLCSRCIVRCMSASGKEVERGILMSCPSKCTQQTIIADGNVQNLPKNFAVMEIIHGSRLERSVTRATLPISGEYICDVCESSGAEVVCPSCAVCLCLPCSADIHSKKGYQVHRLLPVADLLDGSLDSLPGEGMASQRSFSDSELLSSKEQQKMCKVHTSELVEYLCESCCEEVCKRCHLLDDHRDHECRLLTEVALEKRQSLRQLLGSIQQKHASWNTGFDRCQELREYVNTRQTELEGAIKSHFHEIHSALHSREEKILKMVQNEMATRDVLLSKQADHLAKVCAIAKELCEDCEEIMGASNSEVIQHADPLVAQIQQHIRLEQDTNPVVTESIQADFESKGELLQLVEKLGKLKLSPGRVEDVQVKGRGLTDVHITWQPLPTPVNTYLVEMSSGGRPYRVIYEGSKCEHVADGFMTEEDTHYLFRVAAVNDVGIGSYSMSVSFTQRKALFLWDPNLCHHKAIISNGGYTVSIGENATWVSVGTNTVLSHGRHYWEVVLERYGSPSMSRKVVIGVVASSFHHWHKSHGVIGIKTCPIGTRSWGLACGTAKKLSHGSTFLNSLGRKHNLFREGDAVGVLLDLSDHTMVFYRNGVSLGIRFTDVYGPVIPAISFCRHKTLTLRFPEPPAAPPAPVPISGRGRSDSVPIPMRNAQKLKSVGGTL